MNSKIKNFAAMAISLFATSAMAQGPYAKINTGYNSGINSIIIANYISTWNGSVSTQYNEAVNLNFGKGVNIDAAFGFKFNENIGAELGFSHLIGGKTVATSTNTNPSSFEDNKITFSSSMLRINPSIVLSLEFEKINPYAKFGFLIGFGSIKTVSEENETNIPSNTTTTKYQSSKSNGGIALGFNSAFGVDYIANEKTSFFAEITLMNLTYAPKKRIITEYIIDGIDQLSTLTTSEKETKFSNSYSYNSSSATNSNIPSHDLKQNMPFNSFGVNIGVKFGF